LLSAARLDAVFSFGLSHRFRTAILCAPPGYRRDRSLCGLAAGDLLMPCCDEVEIDPIISDVQARKAAAA
jgi:hypothetical protein